jgi:protein-tyrosine phosphatase
MARCVRAPPNEILPYLYLGNAFNGADKRNLKELGISRILSVKEAYSPLQTRHPDFKILSVPLSDYGNQDLTEVFDICFNFIEDAKNNNEKVLVHCRGGINRSPTIVLAYLMVREQWRLRQAYQWVKTRRKQISPHEGYWKQLQALELRLYGSISLTMEEIGPTLQDVIRDIRKKASLRSTEAKVDALSLIATTFSTNNNINSNSNISNNNNAELQSVTTKNNNLL